MPYWIEVPAHRIYVCTIEELEARFTRIGKDGQLCPPFEVPEFFYRDDGKRFSHARFLPAGINPGAATPQAFKVYLEEI